VSWYDSDGNFVKKIKPDGDQIMVSQWANPQSETDRNYNILVIDLVRQISVKIDENKHPEGWMVK